jgi:outer membrane lipoprotein carrier protein
MRHGAHATLSTGLTLLMLALPPDAVARAAAAPVASQSPAASPSTPLDEYLDNLRTLRVTFLQTLADPHGREIDRATGTLIVQRPGKFRWETEPQPLDAAGAASGSAPGASAGGGHGRATGPLLVCDGTNLWFYDRELQQVTVKPVNAVLSATPAMLLSGAVDVRKSFTMTSAGRREDLDWVLVEPNGTDADFRRALFGFAHGELKRMILEDRLDQTATIIFQKIERNGPVLPGEVSFTVPPGVDVIGTPRK